MTVGPTVPVPMSAAPLFTVVKIDDAIEPSTISAPAFTVVGPVYVLVPVIVAPVPFCWSAPEPEITPP
jgi:hypothetical protein